MATRRMLAASIGVSEQVAALADDFTRLLFTWMIAHADDWGVMPGSAPRVRAIVVPMLDCTNAQVDAALDNMDAHDLIWRYAAPDGTKLVQFRTWEEHQQGLHKRTAPKLLRYCDVVPGMSGNVSELPPLARARGTELNGRELNRREREGARAREGQGATADAAPVSLSPSLVNAVDAEPEPEPEQKLAPATTPVASDPLHEACVVALGHGPTTGRMRRKWRDGLADLAALNVTPDDVPKLVRQYRAKYGDQIPCEPWNLADRYPELGVHPYVTAVTVSNATNGHAAAHLNGSGSVSQASADSADYTRRKREALAQLGVALPALPPAPTGTDPTTPH